MSSRRSACACASTKRARSSTRISRAAPGHFRPAAPADLNLLATWTEVFVSEARIPEPVDAVRIVQDAITRGRLHVWEDDKPVSMAAWTGKTPSGVRINFVYTPRELRGKGYGYRLRQSAHHAATRSGQCVLLALHGC